MTRSIYWWAFAACAVYSLMGTSTASAGRDEKSFPVEVVADPSESAASKQIRQTQAIDQPPPSPESNGKVLPIDLPTALLLANVNPIDIQLASERLAAACARLDRARVLWLPNIATGLDYARHDGQIQDVAGNVFTTSRSALMLGLGPNATFAVTDSLYAPLVARQIVRSRQADVQTARNDVFLAVAEAYFSVQQARGEVAGAIEATRLAQALVERIEQLTPAFAPRIEVGRARTELARRRQAVQSAYERWQLASSDLTRLLRLDPTVAVEPTEPLDLHVDLIDLKRTPEDWIGVGLAQRPELASRHAAIQAAQTRIKQEKMRPLLPNVLLRGNATNPSGTLSSGYFGGGINDNLSNFGGRNSYDVQFIWELQNLGMGNRAAVAERGAERREAMLELTKLQDRIASEVVQAHAQARRATARIDEATQGVRDARETAEKNLDGLRQTRRVGEINILVFRPQEAVAAISALDQAYRDLFAALGDANRAQFRLHRAVGHSSAAIAPTVTSK